jgi:hypothetical protein
MPNELTDVNYEGAWTGTRRKPKKPVMKRLAKRERQMAVGKFHESELYDDPLAWKAVLGRRRQEGQYGVRG